jgi:hypothetical protein
MVVCRERMMMYFEYSDGSLYRWALARYDS